MRQLVGAVLTKTGQLLIAISKKMNKTTSPGEKKSKEIADRVKRMDELIHPEWASYALIHKMPVIVPDWVAVLLRELIVNHSFSSIPIPHLWERPEAAGDWAIWYNSVLEKVERLREAQKKKSETKAGRRPYVRI
jgi:hypothetical protein